MLSAGLSYEAAKEKLRVLGHNEYKKKVQIPWYYQLLECFTNLFNLVLIFAALVFFFFYGLNPMDNFQNVIKRFLYAKGLYRRDYALHFIYQCGNRVL